ncbi:MAG: TVP38/TMEM64 family protein [Hyphomonadaceae bacterium]
MIAKVIIVVLIAGALAAAWRFGLFDLLSLETLRARRHDLLAFVTAHRFASLAIFIGIYALATLFALPGVLWITIAGGFLFGLATGALATALGATLGATGLFLAARHLFADALARRAGAFLSRLEAGFQRNAISYLLSLRLIPIVPFFIANIAPAFLGVRTTTFVATTFIGILPGVVAYTWIGAGLGAVFDAGGEPDLASFARQMAPALVALGLLSLAPVIVGRFRTKSKPANDAKD